MRRPILLVIVLGLVVVLIAALLALFLPRPEFRFFTLEDSYRTGDTVEFRLENNHVSWLCFPNLTPWGVSRLVGEEWVRVELHASLQAESSLAPGRAMEWSWVATDSDVREQYGLAEVVPGDYRGEFPGTLCESPDNRSTPGTRVELFAHFELVA